MMKRLLALQLTLLLLFGTATSAVYFLGRLNRHPAEQIITVKWNQDARACWNSICPGQTMLGDSSVVLNSLPTMRIWEDGGSWFAWKFTGSPNWLVFLSSVDKADYAQTDNIIKSIELRCSDDSFRLGDAIALFGEPIAADIYFTKFRSAVGVVVFRGNILVMFKPGLLKTGTSLGASRFTPDLVIHEIYIVTDNSQVNRYPRWAGFTIFTLDST